MFAIILATIGALFAFDAVTFGLEFLFGTIIGAAMSRLIAIVVIVIMFKKCMNK